MTLLLAAAAAAGAAATAKSAAGAYHPPPPPPAPAPPPAIYTLSVAKGGGGTGTVTSTPGGIACGSDCSEAFASGASVTLSATPDAGSSFSGWAGACTGSGPCTVAMDAAKSVTATFTAGAGQVAAPQDTAIQASVTKVEFVVRAGKRISRAELTLGEDVRATVALVRRGRVLVTKAVTLGAGQRRVSLRIPPGVSGGPATMRIVLEDGAGNRTAIARRVRVPPA